MTVVRDLSAAITDGQTPRQRVAVVDGTVQTVAAGAAVDGRAQVTVLIGVDLVPCSYYDSYTPAVGHQVEVLLVDGSPRILGRLVGQPTL